MTPRVHINPSNDTPRFDSPLQMYSFLKYVKYKEFDYLMSPEEVIIQNQGSCHDQASFVLDELNRQGYTPIGKFLMVADDDGTGGETHSFVYFIWGDKFCWAESSWADYYGLNTFSTEQELLEYVIDAFTNRNPGKTLYMGDFILEDHTPGEDLATFVDICMENAIQV